MAIVVQDHYAYDLLIPKEEVNDKKLSVDQRQEAKENFAKKAAARLLAESEFHRFMVPREVSKA